MSGQAYERFFLEPNDSIHRRYETLRAVFVDKLPMKEVAGRFDVHYGTVRNWASEFRAQHEAKQAPFFSRAATSSRMTNKMTPSNTPMSKHCRWRPDDAWSRVTPVSFCFSRCWPLCDLIGSCKRRTTPVRKWCLPPMRC